MKYEKDFKKATKNLDEAEKLRVQLASLLEVAGEMYAEGDLKGKFTRYYVPFFVEMEAEGHLETLCYIVYLEAGEKFAEKWIEEHPDSIREMLEWAFMETDG